MPDNLQTCQSNGLWTHRLVALPKWEISTSPSVSGLRESPHVVAKFGPEAMNKAGRRSGPQAVQTNLFHAPDVRIDVPHKNREVYRPGWPEKFEALADVQGAILRVVVHGHCPPQVP